MIAVFAVVIFIVVVVVSISTCRQTLKAEFERNCFDINDRELFSEESEMEQITELPLGSDPEVWPAVVMTSVSRALFLTYGLPHRVITR